MDVVRQPVLDRAPWLRLEGLAVFAAGLVGFLALGAPWYLFALPLLVPDVSTVGYLGGPRLGAVIYNVVHELFTGAASPASGSRPASARSPAAGAILIAHVGMDRTGLRPEAADLVPGHAPGAHRQARGLATSRTGARGATCPSTRSR